MHYLFLSKFFTQQKTPGPFGAGVLFDSGLIFKPFFLQVQPRTVG
jgi:hypothetical protein